MIIKKDLAYLCCECGRIETDKGQTIDKYKQPALYLLNFSAFKGETFYHCCQDCCDRYEKIRTLEGENE